MEGGEPLIELASHADVLRTTAGEEEHHTGCRSRGTIVDRALSIAGPQQLDRIGMRARNHDPAARVRTPTGGESEGDIGEVGTRMTFEVIGKVVRNPIERGIAASRKRERLDGEPRIGRHGHRCFFDDDVRVGTADAERRDAGAAR